METWRWILSVFLEAHFRSFFLSVFSLFWRENFLMGQKEKHLSSTIYFPSSPLNQTHSKKVFLPIFSSKFSIIPISLPNKHTLRDFGINAWDFSELSVRLLWSFLPILILQTQSVSSKPNSSLDWSPWFLSSSPLIACCCSLPSFILH